MYSGLATIADFVTMRYPILRLFSSFRTRYVTLK